MKRLIADVYKLIYKVTRAKGISVYGAIAYVTLLQVITIKGLALLLEGWLHIMRNLRVFFMFPAIIVIAVILFSINLSMMMPLSNLKKERKKDPLILPIIVYSAGCALLVLYMRLGIK